MHEKCVPLRLWDFTISRAFETGNVAVSSSRYAEGCTPLEILSGETPDITEYLDFLFYDCVPFKQNTSLCEPELVSWLDVSHRVGPLMVYWILPK